MPLAPPVKVLAIATELFGPRLGLTERFAGMLATAGIERGLIGPREHERLWERHLVNCAVVQELVPDRAHVVDVGSGAGLPGVVLALAREDLRVTLVEPLQRRVNWLEDVVAALGLGDQVSVVRARAEECAVRDADVVASRAVAPLDRLVTWCVPLAKPGGTVMALKGRSVDSELDQHRHALNRIGVSAIEVVRCELGQGLEPTTVVTMRTPSSNGRPEARPGRGRRHRSR